MGQFKHMLAAREFTGSIQLIDIGECEVSKKTKTYIISKQLEQCRKLREILKLYVTSLPFRY